jgi:hypothetical protein
MNEVKWIGRLTKKGVREWGVEDNGRKQNHRRSLEIRSSLPVPPVVYCYCVL